MLCNLIQSDLGERPQILISLKAETLLENRQWAVTTFLLVNKMHWCRAIYHVLESSHIDLMNLQISADTLSVDLMLQTIVDHIVDTRLLREK